MKIKTLFNKNKSLIVYVGLSYFDKALVFLLPIIVLYIANDELTYNDIEYICSIGNIVVPFLTFLSAYSFYGYKKSDDKQDFVNLYKLYSVATVIIIGVLSIILAHIASLYEIGNVKTLEWYIAIRIAFYAFIQYFNSYYRLVDHPIKSLLYSVLTNVVSAFALFTVVLFDFNCVLEAFFYPELITAVASLSIIIKSRSSLVFKDFGCFLAKAIRFSWPIVLSSTAVAFVANYGKVYAYNCLSEYEMYYFSFILRMVTILQMSHAALISFFSKEIYINGYSRKFLWTYVLVMTFSLIAVLGILIGYNTFFATQPIPIDATCFLTLIYTLLHMSSAVLEVDYSRKNKNIYIFVFSTLSCALYIFLIYVIGVHNVTTLALYMVVYMAMYFILLFAMWRKKLCRLEI